MTRFILTILAARRLTGLIVDDVVFDQVREKIWSVYPPNRSVGYLITCRRCSSVWAGLVVVLLSQTSVGRTIIVALALSEATIDIDELFEIVTPKSLM